MKGAKNLGGFQALGSGMYPTLFAKKRFYSEINRFILSLGQANCRCDEDENLQW
jgi:hypothetical protein